MAADLWIGITSERGPKLLWRFWEFTGHKAHGAAVWLTCPITGTPKSFRLSDGRAFTEGVDLAWWSIDAPDLELLAAQSARGGARWPLSP